MARTEPPISAAPGSRLPPSKAIGRLQRGARNGRQHQEDAKRSADVQRHQRSRKPETETMQAQAARAAQRGANTSVPFVPPKPKELERATRIGILRAALGT